MRHPCPHHQVYRLLTGAALGLTLALSAPAQAWPAPPQAYRYVVTGETHETHQATPGDGEATLCAAPETARYDGRWTVELTSTVADLTDDQVLALLTAELDGSVLHVRYTAGGTLIQHSASHTYSTTYSDGYTGDLRGVATVFHSSFTANGTSELGTDYSIRARGSFRIINGIFHESRTPLQVKGCLP